MIHPEIESPSRRRPTRSRSLPNPRSAVLYAAAFTIGLAAFLGGRKDERGIGGWIMAIAAFGLIRWTAHWREAIRAEKAEEEAEAQRKELRAVRRERVLRERELRREARAAKAAAVAQEEERRAERQEAARLHTLAEAGERAERERCIQAETSRLAALADSDFPPAAAAIYAERGCRVLPADPDKPDSEGDFRLLLAEDALEIARCLPKTRVASALDVEALEAWRVQTGARHAYLIAPAGFAPVAVRCRADLPITLIDLQLLAHWRMTARTE